MCYSLLFVVVLDGDDLGIVILSVSLSKAYVLSSGLER